MKFLNLALILSIVVHSKAHSIPSNHNPSLPYDSSQLNYCQAGKPSVEKYDKIKGYTLQTVQVITRHGDRTPMTVLKTNEENVMECTDPKEFVSLNDPKGPSTHLKYIDTSETFNPFVEKSFWKGTCFPGQLTKKGSKQHIELGKTLKKIYIDKLKFIDEKDLSKLYVRSTDVLRTELSARSLLTGFMPNRKESIPINVSPSEIEYIAPNMSNCPAFMNSMIKLRDEDEWKKYIAEYEDLHEKLVEYTGYSSNKDGGFQPFVDIVLSKACANLKLPCKNGKCNYNTEMLKKLNDAADFEFDFMFSKSSSNVKIVSLGLGYLLEEIVNNMENNLSKKKNNPKFYIYSAHDLTVGPVMGALGLDKVDWSPYASNVIFELWKNNKSKSNSTNYKDYIVRLIYNGKVIKPRWCKSGQCTLSEVQDRLKVYYPVDGACNATN